MTCNYIVKGETWRESTDCLVQSPLITWAFSTQIFLCMSTNDCESTANIEYWFGVYK